MYLNVPPTFTNRETPEDALETCLFEAKVLAKLPGHSAVRDSRLIRDTEYFLDMVSLHFPMDLRQNGSFLSIRKLALHLNQAV